MSTILKALKQSEARRPRDGGLPDALPAASDARRARSAWPLALVAATLSAGAAAWWFLEGGNAPEQPETAQRRVAEVQLPERETKATAGRQDDAGAVNPDRARADGTSSPGTTGAEAGDGAGSGAGDASSKERDESPAAAGEVAAREKPAADATLEAPAPDDEAEDKPASPADEAAAGASAGAAQGLDPYAMLPRLAHLSEQRRSSLPGLKLNAHVYAPEPQQSFVLIELSRYREGDAIAPGVTLAAIFPGGVVIEDDQGRFVVPRP